ncbi:hypothetical protein PFISCL1PPCAC_15843, partial [Pristionchus fissidentatus]
SVLHIPVVPYYIPMHLLLLTSLFCPLLFAESIYIDERAYLALKISSPKITERVTSLHDAARKLHKKIPDFYRDVSEFFSDPTVLEMRLIEFNYDAAEHEKRITRVMNELSSVVCTSFPKYLPFDRFASFNTTKSAGIQGRLQYKREAIEEFKTRLYNVLN